MARLVIALVACCVNGTTASCQPIGYPQPPGTAAGSPPTAAGPTAASPRTPAPPSGYPDANWLPTAAPVRLPPVTGPAEYLNRPVEHLAARTALEPVQPPLGPATIVEPVPVPPIEQELGVQQWCQPCPGGYPSLARLIWQPSSMGCGQLGCQRLWGDPNWDPPGFTLAGLARGYYLDDQRIQWSGLEATFGAEGVLNPRYVRRFDNWLVRADGVFFLNQPFEPNILVDDKRRSYVENFYPDVFQIWQLNLGFTRGDFTVAVGKDRTPFGRYYFPIYSNSYFDSPFIRSEVIRWVETGLFLRYTPGPLNLEVAVTNGGFDRDTNSSKALLGRAGIDTPFWALGASAKVQDGFGSEDQKLHNSHYGFDAMLRLWRFELSAETIWDEYGFREPFDPDDIFWGRSIYYRDIYNGEKDGSLNGHGYYFNLAWVYGRLRIDLNYGEYFPEQIGNPLQDAGISRSILQGSLEVLPGLYPFLVVMGENDRPTEAWRSGQRGFVLYTGVQWVF